MITIDNVVFTNNKMKIVDGTKCSIEFYVVPNGVKTIGNGAFQGNNNIKTVIFPSSCNLLEPSAFSRCENLESVIMDQSQIVTISERCFDGCSKLKEVKFSNSIREIGSEAFSNSGLEQLDLQAYPNLKIHPFCFSGSSLKEVTVPRLSPRMFINCQSLEKVTITEPIREIPKLTFYGCENLKNIDIPDTVTIIGYQSFYNTGIQNLTLPPNLKKLERCSFNWDRINTITSKSREFMYIDGTLYDSDYNIYCCKTKDFPCNFVIPNITVKEGAFENNTYIKELVCSFPIEFEHCSFQGCTSLKRVNIITPNIIGNPFKNCYDLRSVVIRGCNTISQCGFSRCNQLKYVDLEVEVLNSSFIVCDNLTKVTLRNIKNLGSNIFRNCPKLETIMFDIPPYQIVEVDKDCFLNLHSLKNILVPKGELWYFKRILNKNLHQFLKEY